jgi:hypothetical protein
VCARGSDRALLRGPSTSPLDAMIRYATSIPSAVLAFTAAVALSAAQGQVAPGYSPLGASATAQGLTVAAPTITPVFSQLVVFTLPAHFLLGGFERTNGTFYIHEHVPAGESVQSWTRMITLTGAKDLALNPAASLTAYVGRMTAGYEKHCPSSYALNQLGPQVIDGHETFAAVVSCGTVTEGASSHSETAIILGIKGTSDYYTLQWAERGAPSDKPLNLGAEYWTARIGQLYPVRLCPIIPGERAPYPSCINKK